MLEYAPLCAAVIASYLLGAIPFGLLIAQARGIDIRKTGSGNIGATNVFRSVGKTWGILTFACDALKGFLPAYYGAGIVCLARASIKAGITPDLLCSAATPSVDLEMISLLCGFAAIAGHNWPVYLGFKGGKGVATSAGALIGIAPLAVAVGLAVWIVFLVATRYVSVASIAAALAIGGAAWFMYLAQSLLLPVALSLLAVLAIWRHKGNIKRLINGTENRFSFSKKQTPEKSTQA